MGSSGRGAWISAASCLSQHRCQGQASVVLITRRGHESLICTEFFPATRAARSRRRSARAIQAGPRCKFCLRKLQWMRVALEHVFAWFQLI
jgi:hypothetical protein